MCQGTNVGETSSEHGPSRPVRMCLTWTEQQGLSPVPGRRQKL